MIHFAEQMQRLESELFRMFLRNLSTTTERLGNISEMGVDKLVEISDQTAREAQEGVEKVSGAAEQMGVEMPQPAHARAKEGPSRQRPKTQPKRAPRKR